jgi:hypothetical protein
LLRALAFTAQKISPSYHNNPRVVFFLFFQISGFRYGI